SSCVRQDLACCPAGVFDSRASTPPRSLDSQPGFSVDALAHGWRGQAHACCLRSSLRHLEQYVLDGAHVAVQCEMFEIALSACLPIRSAHSLVQKQGLESTGQRRVVLDLDQPARDAILDDILDAAPAGCDDG